MARNVVGEELMPCSIEPLTGFYRDASCNTGPEDRGRHVVCAEVTEDFLEFSKSVGNDLSTPMPEYGFEGLTPGDRWCLCAARWQQAARAGMAPASFHRRLATVQRPRIRKRRKGGDAKMSRVTGSRRFIDGLCRRPRPFTLRS